MSHALRLYDLIRRWPTLIRRLKIWILDKCISLCKYGINRNLEAKDYDEAAIGRNLLHDLEVARKEYD